MSGTVHLALNDVRLTLRDRPSLIWMLLLPIAMMWLFGQMGGGQSTVPKIALTVDDRDGGWLARALVDDLGGERVALTRVVATEAPSRTLLIPAGFTENVLRGEQQVLRLVKREGSNEEFGLAAQVLIVRAIVRALGRLSEMLVAAPGGRLPPGDQALAEFRAMAVRPPLVTLDVQTAGRGRPVPRGFAQSVPGILTMTVLMMTVIYGGVFLALERQGGMLRRQSTLPLRRRDIILGKLGGRLAIAVLQTTVLLVAGRFLFGVSWGASPTGLLLLLATYAACASGLATLLGAVTNTPEQASAIGWLVCMVLSGLGGCWWPSEITPAWMRAASHALPTAWAMDGFHALVSFGRGLEAVVVPSLALLGFGVLFAAVAIRFLRFE